MSKHFTGKTYDLTQENFNKVITELEDAKAENQDLNAKLRGTRAELGLLKAELALYSEESMRSRGLMIVGTDYRDGEVKELEAERSDLIVAGLQKDIELKKALAEVEKLKAKPWTPKDMLVAKYEARIAKLRAALESILGQVMSKHLTVQSLAQEMRRIAREALAEDDNNKESKNE